LDSLIPGDVHGNTEIVVVDGIEGIFEFEVLVSEFVVLVPPVVDFESQSFLVKFLFVDQLLLQHVHFQLQGFVRSFQ
jgi:hypothetical protein